MSAGQRWNYYRRIFSAYLGSRRSHITFWHDTPALNPRAFPNLAAPYAPLGEYYMLVREKADYAGYHDDRGIPMLDYHGQIGLQYNPIAIAQWGLANYNQFRATQDQSRMQNTRKAADWLYNSLERNAMGVWVWNHHFNW